MVFNSTPSLDIGHIANKQSVLLIICKLVESNSLSHALLANVFFHPGQYLILISEFEHIGVLNLG